jgi:uncharacterized membrane protein YcaP (DUF421 family)
MRRLRAAIGIGFTWAVAWSAVGLVPRWVLGFVAGLGFSTILTLAEGRRRLDQMTLPRFALWGALGGVLLSAVFSKAASLAAGDVLMIVPTFAIASAVCASGSLALARRAAKPAVIESHT